MNEDPEYLTKFHIRIFDGKGNEIPPDAINWQTTEAVKYTFRQDPGGENSMGHCKIDFYNPYDVYMHDTPQKALFGENARFHSSGCVRCENIDELVDLAAARQRRLGPRHRAGRVRAAAARGHQARTCRSRSTPPTSPPGPTSRAR